MNIDEKILDAKKRTETKEPKKEKPKPDGGRKIGDEGEKEHWTVKKGRVNNRVDEELSIN